VPHEDLTVGRERCHKTVTSPTPGIERRILRRVR
jgi:hypothetical protein